MSFLSKAVLLFLLNWLDAQLTIFWVRAGLATEGNYLMALLLDQGDAVFLLVKLLIGFFTVYVLYRFSHLRLAERGLKVALGAYLLLMLVHAATALSALEQTEPALIILQLPQSILHLFA